ncbi:MAG: DUF2635 domain-containing protein [Gammaproteobacteria bacterium]|nr:DUF2635 domain-containing protein [Gammaproteobacteria bacterium]
MDKTTFLKPTNDTVCPRDPQTLRRLAPEGEEKILNTFWRRRLKDGDVEIAKPPKKAKKEGNKS